MRVTVSELVMKSDGKMDATLTPKEQRATVFFHACALFGKRTSRCIYTRCLLVLSAPRCEFNINGQEFCSPR